MAWLLFMDESGHSHKELPYEVRGGYALADTHLWPFVQDVLQLELSCFGARLADYKSEVKGMTAPTRPEIEARFGARIQQLNWKGEGYDGVHTYKSFGIFCLPDLYIPRT
jgi:hypothetical protein